MRINSWITQQFVQFILKLFRDDVFELIGLLMNLVSGVAMLACQVEFEQSVGANDLYRFLLS